MSPIHPHCGRRQVLFRFTKQQHEPEQARIGGGAPGGGSRGLRGELDRLSGVLSAKVQGTDFAGDSARFLAAFQQLYVGSAKR